MASWMSISFVKSALFPNAKYNPLYTSIRNTSIPEKRKVKRGTIKHRNLIRSTCESLGARGFLRSLKPYNPPSNVSETVTAICQTVLGSNYTNETNLSKENKFALLNACFMKLNHSVPNSLLHKIVSVGDVLDFYKTSVTTTTPYDELLNQDLPPNLYIQADYIRFHPESSTNFKGISAFPETSTIVTGLKYKGKYKGYKAKIPESYCNNAIFEKENSFE